MNKDDIRRAIRARKALMSADEMSEAAERVFTRLQTMAPFVMARNILFYNALPDELPTRPFIDNPPEGKRYFLPRVCGPDLDILPYTRSRTHLGAFRIEEPDGDDTVDISEIDLIIVPGIAFDRTGARLGRGRGYYDRLLTSARAATIGIGFGFQLIDSIDTEPHDIAMHYVIADGFPTVDARRR